MTATLAIVALGACAWSPGVAAADTPFWGARESRPAGTPVSELQQGEFIWLGDAARSGPLLLVVSLDEQLAYVYRNGVLTGVSTASTGKRGYETPPGCSPSCRRTRITSRTSTTTRLPYMQRLTWGGIALRGWPAGLSGLARLHPAAE
jgi:hypothetical protein